MIVTNNQTFRVTTSANINASKGRVMVGGMLKTITFPEKKDGEDTILVKYTGQNGTGEAPTGTKFRVKVMSLAKIAQLVK